MDMLRDTSDRNPSHGTPLSNRNKPTPSAARKEAAAGYRGCKIHPLAPNLWKNLELEKKLKIFPGPNKCLTVLWNQTLPLTTGKELRHVATDDMLGPVGYLCCS